MGLLDSLKNAPASAWNALKGVASDAKDTAGDALDVAKETPGFAKDVFESTTDAAKHLAQHPPDLDQIKRMGGAIAAAIRTGEKQYIYGDMPAYPKIDAQALERARQRAAGKTIAQPFIASNPEETKINEPINLVVTGSRQELVDALRKAGWRQAPGRTTENYLKMVGKTLFGTEKDTNGPVSVKYIDGREEVLAFNKNDDYNVGRDHLRIFPAAPEPVTGRERWQIAGTRDECMILGRPEIGWDGLKPIITQQPIFNHRSDRAIDGERDLILQSLLDAGVVSDWSAVQGKPDGKVEKQPDGSYKLNGQWKTDGYVYDVTLAGPAPEAPAQAG